MSLQTLIGGTSFPIISSDSQTVMGRRKMPKTAAHFRFGTGQRRIRAFSGAEKSRRAMARMLCNPPKNFLVLDESTKLR